MSVSFFLLCGRLEHARPHDINIKPCRGLVQRRAVFEGLFRFRFWSVKGSFDSTSRDFLQILQSLGSRGPLSRSGT